MHTHERALEEHDHEAFASILYADLVADPATSYQMREFPVQSLLTAKG